MTTTQPANDQLAFHTDGSPCERAVTTRDCPERHRYVTSYGTMREADTRHEYESERGALEPTGRCTVCGESYSAAVHA